MELNITKNIYVCAVCSATGYDKLKKCGRCQVPYYCSAECQKRHWNTHKPECSTDESLNSIKRLINRWEAEKDEMYFKLFDRYKEFEGCMLIVKNKDLFLRGIANGSFNTRAHVPETTHVMVAGCVGKLSEANHAYSISYFKDRAFMLTEFRKMKSGMNMKAIDPFESVRKYMMFTVLDTDYSTFWADGIVDID